MPTFSELKQAADDTSQVRKVLEAVAYWMPMSTPLPTTLLSADKSLNAVPTDAIPLGAVTKEGYKFSTDVEKSEVDAFGYANPVRTDIEKAPKSIEFTSVQ